MYAVLCKGMKARGEDDGDSDERFNMTQFCDFLNI